MPRASKAPSFTVGVFLPFWNNIAPVAILNILDLLLGVLWAILRESSASCKKGVQGAITLLVDLYTLGGGGGDSGRQLSELQQLTHSEYNI